MGRKGIGRPCTSWLDGVIKKFSAGPLELRDVKFKFRAREEGRSTLNSTI